MAFFLAGLVVLGGLQQWWLQPLLPASSPPCSFSWPPGLTAITDNAALTYLASLVQGVIGRFQVRHRGRRGHRRRPDHHRQRAQPGRRGDPEIELRGRVGQPAPALPRRPAAHPVAVLAFLLLVGIAAAGASVLHRALGEFRAAVSGGAFSGARAAAGHRRHSR